MKAPETIADHNDIGAFIFRVVKVGRVPFVCAVVVNQSAWVGNSGGQRTARPTTTKCANVMVICHRLGNLIYARIANRDVPGSASCHLNRSISGTQNSPDGYCL